VRSPLWLRRLAVNPATVSAYPEIGIEQKLARDLTDDEVRAIAAYHGRRSKLKQLDEAWFVRALFEERERARDPLQGEGFLSVAGLAWSWFWLKASRRSSAIRWLYRLRGRIEDRLRRDDGDDWIGEEGDDDQIAFGGSALSAIRAGRDSVE